MNRFVFIAITIRAFVAMFVILGIARFTQAQNNGFLPGDAFFATTISSKQVSGLEKPSQMPREFEYVAMGKNDNFGGYAGYWKAHIPTVDDAFANNLAKIYREMHSHGGRELLEMRDKEGNTTWLETNAVRVFFYSQKYDLREHSLALKYNENWRAEVEKFVFDDFKKSPLRLGCFVDSRDAVELSWSLADQVPALKTDRPTFEVTMQRVDAVLTIEEPVQAIILADNGRSLVDYYNPAGKDDILTLKVVTQESIVTYEREGWLGNWEVADGR